MRQKLWEYAKALGVFLKWLPVMLHLLPLTDRMIEEFEKDFESTDRTLKEWSATIKEIALRFGLEVIPVILKTSERCPVCKDDTLLMVYPPSNRPRLNHVSARCPDCWVNLLKAVQQRLRAELKESHECTQCQEGGG